MWSWWGRNGAGMHSCALAELTGDMLCLVCLGNDFSRTRVIGGKAEGMPSRYAPCCLRELVHGSEEAMSADACKGAVTHIATEARLLERQWP